MVRNLLGLKHLQFFCNVFHSLPGDQPELKKVLSIGLRVEDASHSQACYKLKFVY